MPRFYRFFVSNVSKDGVGGVTSCGQGSLWRVDALRGMAADGRQTVDSVATPDIIGHDCGFRAEVSLSFPPFRRIPPPRYFDCRIVVFHAFQDRMGRAHRAICLDQVYETHTNKYGEVLHRPRASALYLVDNNCVSSCVFPVSSNSQQQEVFMIFFAD